MKRIIVTALCILLTGIFFIVACQDNGSASSGIGKLTVKITDAPFPIELVSEVDVTITKIELRSTDSTMAGSPYVAAFEGNLSVNLMDLRNGVTSDLPEITLPVGSYDLVRIYISNAMVTLTDSTQYDLKIPSAASSGLKIFIQPDLEIAGDLSAELLLDFDISRSFVVLGNPHTPAGIKGFHFKPVIRAVNNSYAGSVKGIVIDGSSQSVLADAYVWLAQDSVVSYTYSDSTGHYALLGVPAETYSIGASKAGYDTVMVPEINIVAGNAITQNFELTVQ